MGTRWSHKVVEVSFSLFGSKLSEKIQAELDKFGALGWELVAVNQTLRRRRGASLFQEGAMR